MHRTAPAKPTRPVAPLIANCPSLLYAILRYVHGLGHEEAYRRTFAAAEELDRAA